MSQLTETWFIYISMDLWTYAPARSLSARPGISGLLCGSIIELVMNTRNNLDYSAWHSRNICLIRRPLDLFTPAVGRGLVNIVTVK